MSLTNTDKNTLNDILHLLVKKVGAIPAIQPLRESHRSDFEKMGLPGKKHEEYRNTPLSRALDKFDFASIPEQAGTAASLDVQNFFIPESDGYPIVFVNGIFNATHSSNSIPGIIFLPLDKALDKFPEKVLPWLSKIDDGGQDAFVAWNGAAWNSGAFISIPDNVVVGKPVIIYDLVDARQNQVINTTRNLFITGRNSEVTIIHKFNSTGTFSHFSNIVTEAVVNENAGMNLFTIQNDTGDQYHFNHTRIHQKNSSRVNTWAFSLDGKMLRNNLHLSLNGEGCESHMYGLYLLKGDTLADNHTVADHQKPNSYSNELYKGIMDDNSRGVFNGKIYVRPNAQKTNAFQSNRNILLTDTAKVNTKPQLEIWADDVKCSHGCTAGQLDEEALFYLQSRGIDKQSAQGMLLYAFAGEVIDTIPVDFIKNHLAELVRERLHQTQ